MPRRSLIAIFLIVLLGALAYAISITATLSKSPTSDEPLHLAAHITQRFLNDYRFDTEDPPLWRWISTLPFTNQSFTIDTSSVWWPRTLQNPSVALNWIDIFMFRTPGNDGGAILNRSRICMGLVGFALIVTAGLSAMRLGGPVAGVIAAGMLALEPTVLGHMSLVKNDISITLLFLLLAASVWCAMARITWKNLLCMAVLCGVGASVKYSGVMFLPFASLVLLIRAVQTRDWTLLGRVLPRRGPRLLAAFCAIAMSAVVTWIIIWSAYGFRFRPTPQPGSTLNVDWFVHEMASRQSAMRLGRLVSAEEIAETKPSAFTNATLFVDRHRLLPQPFIWGFYYTYASALSRHGYLLGELRYTGWWYYFPLAIIFKTATASLVALLACLAALCSKRVRVVLSLSDEPIARAMICTTVFAGVYLLAAMKGNLNLGIRHVLPVYPFLYIAVAVLAARAIRVRRALAPVACALGIALVAETALAYPNFISFFNAASGGTRNGVRLLGDSNLDWGQDLTLVAKWQSAHPGVRIYLCASWFWDPEYYGIDYRNLPGGYWKRPGIVPDEPGVMIISTNVLQGLYLSGTTAEKYQSVLRDYEPREILGGSLYVYDFPPRAKPTARP